ncbi:MAG: hypothetical protein JWN62_888 [Acidimicrobiales bacterium]|nr:hypothetical protein [Acidimicrobiales bacterium]
MNEPLDRSIIASLDDIASRAPALGEYAPSRRIKIDTRPRRAPLYAIGTLLVGAAALISVVVLRSSGDHAPRLPGAGVPLPSLSTAGTNPASSAAADAPTTAAPTPTEQTEPPVNPSMIDGCLSQLPGGGTSLDPACFMRLTSPADRAAFTKQLNDRVLRLDQGYALYTVAAGDTVERIATTLDRPLSALLAANGGSADMIIFPTMPLLVPPLYTHDLASRADQPAGTEGVVTMATGVLAGFVPAPDNGIFTDDLHLPGISGPAVRLPDGTITGYFVAGPTGFVDINLVNDTAAFQLLIQCDNSASTGVTPGPECDVPFLRQGVNPYLMAQVAAANAALPGYTPPTIPTDHSRPATVGDPTRILLLGDNTAADLAAPLRSLVDSTGVATLSVDSHVSSGLVRNDFFDWPTHLDQILATVDPDIVIVAIGSNDTQMFPGTTEPVGNDAWRTVYAAKVREFMDAVERGGRTVIWVTAPGQVPVTSTSIQNDIVLQQIAARTDIQLVDAWSLFTDTAGNAAADVLDPRDGEFKPIRAYDQYHLNTTGNEILATYLGQQLISDLNERGADSTSARVPIAPTTELAPPDQTTVAPITNPSVPPTPATNSSVPG